MLTVSLGNLFAGFFEVVVVLPILVVPDDVTNGAIMGRVIVLVESDADSLPHNKL